MLAVVLDLVTDDADDYGLPEVLVALMGQDA